MSTSCWECGSCGFQCQIDEQQTMLLQVGRVTALQCVLKSWMERRPNKTWGVSLFASEIIPFSCISPGHVVKHYMSKTREYLPLHLIRGHAFLCTNRDIHLFLYFAPAAVLIACCKGWVGGGLPHSLLSTLFAHLHSDLCLSAHPSVKQDRGCLLKRAHSTWQSRMPPAEEPPVEPVLSEGEKQ